MNNSELLSNAKIALLTARSDVMGWSALLFTWSAVAAVLAALARWPHPLMWVFKRHRWFPISLFHPPYGNAVQRLVLRFFLGPPSDGPGHGK
ncbi:MAG: hypothetical protein V4857_11760 [Pseudomonadota bacterium]